MRGLLRKSPRALQLLVVVLATFYLGSIITVHESHVVPVNDEQLATCKQLLNANSEDPNLHDNGIKKDEIKKEELEANRTVTAKPISELEIKNEKKEEIEANRTVTAKPISELEIEKIKEGTHEKTTVFIPTGPDETPPEKPANIPKTFPVEESDFCQKRPKMEIISYVHSSISKVEQRKITRETWANATALGLGVNLGVVFMVGSPKTEEEKAIVKEESDKYHDIVQGEYGDHYRLLSYKGLAALYWINKHCSHVPWTLHADDDILVDVVLFFSEIKKLSDDIKKQFICSHMYGPALRTGRWAVSHEEYKNKDYPLYCSGGIWFLETQQIPRLLEASKVVPFLWVDDAYLTGLLAVKADIKRFGFQDHYGKPLPNQEEIGKKVAWMAPSPERRHYWEEIVKFYQNKSLTNTSKIH